MAGGRHDRHTTRSLQNLWQYLRAFDVEDDLLPGPPPLDEVEPEEEHQDVSTDDVTRFVDGADPIRVAVERDPQVRSRLHDARLEIRQVRVDDRIGMVVRERPVRLTEERVDRDLRSHGSQ